MNTGHKWSLGRVGAALFTGLFLIALVFALPGAANAAPSEEDIGASTPLSAPHAPVHRAPTQAPPRERSSSAADTSDASRSVSASPSQPHATFPYTIRPGDSLGSIASQFGVPLAELAHANHMAEDVDLIAGQSLRIPNPFLAREHELTMEIDRLSLDKQAASQRAEKAETALASERAQVAGPDHRQRPVRSQPAPCCLVAQGSLDGDRGRGADAWCDAGRAFRMVDFA